jgi:hypothetical protein
MLIFNKNIFTKHIAAELTHHEIKVLYNFSDAWNKSASVGRAAEGFACIGIMPFFTDIVPEEKFTPSLFEPSSHTVTTLLPLSLLTKQHLPCLSVALHMVICSQNRDTADATASTSNTTNNSAPSSNSNVKIILPTPEKKTSSRKLKTKTLVHLISDQNLEEPEIKDIFFQNDPPLVRVIP